MAYEVHFAPIRRKVKGVHQPDVSYRFNADSMAIATAHARSLIVNEHPGYRYVRTTEVAA